MSAETQDLVRNYRKRKKKHTVAHVDFALLALVAVTGDDTLDNVAGPLFALLGRRRLDVQLIRLEKVKHMAAVRDPLW